MNVVGSRGGKDVGRKKTENDRQIVVRVPQALYDRLEALAAHLGQPGISVTVTDAIRAALHRGVEALESAHKPRKR